MIKYKFKKKYLSILVLLIIMLIITINLFKAKSYSVHYSIGDYDISENYILDKKLYYYEITYNNIKYDFLNDTKYSRKRKVIDDIEKIEEDKQVCLIIKNNINRVLCSIDKQVVDYRLVSEELKNKLTSYYKDNNIIEEKLDNYTLYKDNMNLLVWNYKGFNKIDNKDMTYIKLFNRDIYDVPLATKINNYIIVPDYEEKYEFNKVYIINLNNNKVSEWKLDYSISFDSFVAGINDKSIYIVDINKKVEYELVAHKKKMRKVSNADKGIIFNNKEIENIDINKLVSNRVLFTYSNNYKFNLDNNKLYLSYLDYKNKMLISNLDIDKIVYVDNSSIYFISKDILYKYDLDNGEEKLLKYSELEFNNDNMIIINN